jgi:ATP-dependent Lhr-like helicase
MGFIISKQLHQDVEIGINDNGFYIGTRKRVSISGSMQLLRTDKLDLVMKLAIDRTEVLKRRFRHCATRALMILRNYKGRQKYVGRQQVGSMILMSALKRISPDFSILKEARREVLEDLMDIKSTKKVITMLEKEEIAVETIDTNIPSPFAFKLVTQGHADIMRMEDRLEFLRRMHDMVLAKISLEQGKKAKGT